MSAHLKDVLVDNGRLSKPRNSGLTMVLDKGLGLNQIADLAGVSGAHVDYMKIAWGSALITGNLEEKLAAYHAADMAPLLGGTLFEYCYLHKKTDSLLDFCKDHKAHIEISDGVVDLPRAEKLKWISAFAAHNEVFSEVGGKIEPKRLEWEDAISEELEAGAKKVVIEGREIGPVGKEIREDLIDRLVSGFDPALLFFESLERYQQVWMIKKLGPNVNLGNILPKDLHTLESFRRGLKEHTLLHFSNQ